MSVFITEKIDRQVHVYIQQENSVKLHICKTELEEMSTYSLDLMLTSMEAGESDATQPF